MQSDFEMRRQQSQDTHQEQQQQQQQHRFMMPEIENGSPLFFPVSTTPNPHHFPLLHHLPFTTQPSFKFQNPHFQALLDHHHQQQHQEPSRQINDNEVQVSSPYFPLSFKLGLEDNKAASCGGVVGYVEEEEDALVHGSDKYCPEPPRQTSLAVSHCWQNQEDSAIKQPFWKPLCTEISNGSNNNQRFREDEQEDEETQHNQQFKTSEEPKCRLFGELEAIYTTKAESALNVTLQDNSPINVSFPVALNDSNNQATGKEEEEEEAELLTRIVHKRKRSMKKSGDHQERGSMAFYESLMKKLMDHQECLQKRFMEVIERLDRERKAREEEWREQELAKLQKEEAARAQERTLASTREAALVYYLEKFTGQRINLVHEQTPSKFSSEPTKNGSDKSCRSAKLLHNKRWPIAEVEALIQIRTSLESKFQEPGLKGDIWDEISNSMASMGFQRSSKRCKDKWESIQKSTKKNHENREKDEHENGENKNQNQNENVEVEEVGEGDNNNHE